MFFIGGVNDRKDKLMDINNVICNCGRLTSVELVMYYSVFHMFFIPFFKFNKRYYVISRCCGPFRCSADTAEQIRKSGAVDFSKLQKCEARVYYDL